MRAVSDKNPMRLKRLSFLNCEMVMVLPKVGGKFLCGVRLFESPIVFFKGEFFIQPVSSLHSEFKLHCLSAFPEGLAGSKERVW